MGVQVAVMVMMLTMINTMMTAIQRTPVDTINGVRVVQQSRVSCMCISGCLQTRQHIACMLHKLVQVRIRAPLLLLFPEEDLRHQTTQGKIAAEARAALKGRNSSRKTLLQHAHS